MPLKHLNNIRATLLAAIMALAAQACVDDVELPSPPTRQPEGEEAFVTLGVSAGDMAAVSRDNSRDYQVTSIWIGLFNATTGELKGYYIAEGFEKNTPVAVWQNVSIKTTSGATRVAGVANFESYNAVAGDKTIPLRDALMAVADWDDYRKDRKSVV